ncbi:MAG: response regulator [Planctomycetota bacterium]
MSSHTILIADDDRLFLEAVRARLEAEGFEVIAVQDAYQALEQARTRQPDVLVLDINMPAGNGFSVQQRADKIEEIAGIPVVYVTGASAEAVDSQAIEKGAFAVVHKPFETAELLDAIRGALGYWTDGRVAA